MTYLQRINMKSYFCYKFKKMKKILTSIYPFLVLNLVEEHTNQGMQYGRVEKKKSFIVT